MSFLSMMEAKLPPGFRFHPRDDELVCDYLAKKISCGGGGVISSFFGERSPMINVDLNKCEPWDLPELACMGGGKEWYLFSLRDRKYSSGERRNRATASGYWKATGKDRHITRKGLLVGMRKTLVFYQGRAPKGSKTHWVMHEFRILQPPPPPPHGHYYSTNKEVEVEEDWVLCRIFYKSSRGDVSYSKPRPMAASMQHDQYQTSYDHEDTYCSSQLPVPAPMPMSMEKYITFGTTADHHHPPAPMSLKLEGPYEQVPCFSTNTTFPTAAPAAPPIPPPPPPRMPTNRISQLGAAQQFGCLLQHAPDRSFWTDDSTSAVGLM